MFKKYCVVYSQKWDNSEDGHKDDDQDVGANIMLNDEANEGNKFFRPCG